MTGAVTPVWPGGRVRRTRHVVLRADSGGNLVAVGVLAGQEFDITLADLQVLLAIPEEEWVPVGAGTDERVLARLAESGLVLSESGGGVYEEFRRRDERLAAPPWNRHAALFHAMTRWSGVHATRPPARMTRDPRRWPPAGHFHSVPDPQATAALPHPETDGAFYDLLRSRRTTTRGFDLSAPVTREQLSTILHWVWGCHGTRVIVPGELTLIRRTSPSGGAQHPTEVYPLIRDVPGVPPGLYHYASEHHALELVDDLGGRDPVAVNHSLLADQDHFASAPVVFYMTSRYGRTFWKYPRHAKAYKVILLDAAHLSQTLYLTCANLGLGAFVTAAFNEVDVDRLLKLEAFTEGSVVVSGCGHPLSPDTEPDYVPFAPG